jgi:hypothetical protein
MRRALPTSIVGCGGWRPARRLGPPRAGPRSGPCGFGQAARRVASVGTSPKAMAWWCNSADQAMNMSKTLSIRSSCCSRSDAESSTTASRSWEILTLEDARGRWGTGGAPSAATALVDAGCRHRGRGGAGRRGRVKDRRGRRGPGATACAEGGRCRGSMGARDAVYVRHDVDRPAIAGPASLDEHGRGIARLVFVHGLLLDHLGPVECHRLSGVREGPGKGGRREQRRRQGRAEDGGARAAQESRFQVDDPFRRGSCASGNPSERWQGAR